MTSVIHETDRLNRHRQAFMLANMTGPLLRFAGLTALERAFITTQFITNSRPIARDDGPALKVCYAETLHLWGIMCPHPQQERLYEGGIANEHPVDFASSQWFDCRVCKTRVINRDT